jgi:hypothetical protein
MAKSAAGVGGKKNPNKEVTVSKKATPYKGGISKSPKGAATTATKYSGGKTNPPKSAIPAKKMGGSYSKGKC